MGRAAYLILSSKTLFQGTNRSLQGQILELLGLSGRVAFLVKQLAARTVPTITPQMA